MTNGVHLRIAESDLQRLEAYVLSTLPREAGAFALAGVSKHRGGTDIIVRRAIRVPDHLFRVQTDYRLEIEPRAVNGLIALCEQNGLGAVLCHSHPGDMPYSPSDDYGEQRVFDAIRPYVPEYAPLASLLFYPGGVRGRAWSPEERRFIPLDSITVVGRRIRTLDVSSSGQNARTANAELYDRQILAFGEQGQNLISRAKVAVVGVGGTGSATAEQLVRLGVEDIVLIDHDRFEPSNRTRVYGSFSSSERRKWGSLRSRKPMKVQLVAEHLRRINPRVRVTAIPQSVVLREAAVGLPGRDVTFLCTDDHWGRSIVNQIAYQYLIPTVNMGVRIASDHGRITGANGAIDILRPDKPCLWCSGFLRAERVTAESTPGPQRQALQAEGYLEGLETPTPSVVSINTAVSGMAVTLFLQLLTGFMGDSGDVTRLNYDPISATVRRGVTATIGDCICKRSKGYGDLRPLHTLGDLSLLDD